MASLPALVVALRCIAFPIMSASHTWQCPDDSLACHLDMGDDLTMLHVHQTPSQGTRETEGATALPSVDVSNDSKPSWRCVPLQGITPDGKGGTPSRAVISEVLKSFGVRFLGTLSIFGAIPLYQPFPDSVQLRLTIWPAIASYNAAAAFSPLAIDIFGDKVASDARRRCQGGETREEYELYADVTATITGGHALIVLEPTWEAVVAEGLKLIMGFDYELLKSAPDNDISTPWGLAKVLVAQLEPFFANDGWNADGKLRNMFNRQPYSDFDFTDFMGRRYTSYEVRPFYLPLKPFWQPLEQSDGRGLVVREQLSTPFIGATAQLLGYSDAILMKTQALQPKLAGYTASYKEEVQEVLDRTASLATNDTKKMLVEYFNQKVTSLVPLRVSFADGFVGSVFEFWAFDVAVNLAEYNGQVQVWREKIRYNRARPTTVVRAIVGDAPVTTYAGPGEGVQEIPGTDWAPYVPESPHPEYPSSSSCVCRAFAEAMQEWTGTDTAPGLLASFPRGSSTREPGITPESDLVVVFSTWSEVARACSASRLDGGMHFAGAVPAGEKLCSGNFAAVGVSKMRLLGAGRRAGALLSKADAKISVRPF